MQTFTSLLFTKKPDPSPPTWPMPMSRNVLGVMRDLGLGLSNLLKDGNTDKGIDLRDDGCGGGYGGSAAVGGG
jgi:hypothetical protein